MICKEFSHIGIRDTAEGVVRTAIAYKLIHPRPNVIFGDKKHGSARVTVLNSDAHTSVSHMPPQAGPAFTFVRNPYD